MLPLDALVAQCAPFVAPRTMSAIVRVESGGDPLAMWNNTMGQRILPPNRAAAIAYLQSAMAAGDKVDVGIAQVDTENFAAYGLTPENAFDACTNLRVGADILRADYRKAVAHFGPGQVALYHAFEAYNSGHLWGDAHYANTVLRSAGIPVYVQRSGLGFAANPHFKNPFTYYWTAKTPSPVDKGYTGSRSGLSVTVRWRTSAR